MIWPRKAAPPVEEDPEAIAAEELAQSTAEIEAEKERRKQEREERKLRKEAEARRKQRERWVAPIILIATFIISLVIKLLMS